MNLANALQSLDVENDEHWTQDGQARLDVLKEMVGSQVTRDDIKEVAPKFTRANNVVTSDKQPDNPFAEDAGKAEKDLEGKSVDGGEEAGETVEVNVTDYDSAKSELQGQLEEAKVKLTEAQKVYDSLVAEMDALVVEEEQANATSFSEDVKAFQKQEHDARVRQIEQTAQMKLMLEAIQSKQAQ
ncbi:MAG: hypothetical protein Unbinned4162contig1001_59 [Prokaryotic dsDNA virus sp.]|nr:MAG: hypothetical protein Unbinned4162contig1001_59 [Prokaryotic dsDNA virus sp.]|tara:strand:- start:47466 stop:48020 length:555 start_codon:yes stop_codon:yes gene_type:complete